MSVLKKFDTLLFGMKTIALFFAVVFFATACVSMGSVVIVGHDDVTVDSVTVDFITTESFEDYITNFQLFIDGESFCGPHEDDTNILSFDLIGDQESVEDIEIFVFDIYVEGSNHDVLIEDLIIDTENIPESHTLILTLFAWTLVLRRRR